MENTGPHPRENSELYGHKSAEKILADSFCSGNMHHAWLITGAKGIGKATLAYHFARFILSGKYDDCEDSGDSLFGDALPSATPDTLYIPQDEQVFTSVSQNAHPNLKVVECDVEEGKTEIPVDTVRAVGKFLSLTAAQDGWRVIIVDSADEMNSNAANALLKILEEPSPKTVLLLVSHSPGRLLPTIISRCRKLPLSTLSEGDTMSVLRQYIPDINGDDARFACAVSGGTPGMALKLYNGGALDIYRQIIVISALQSGILMSEAHKLATSISSKKAAHIWPVFIYCVGHILESTIHAGIEDAGSNSAWHPDEKLVQSKLLAKYSVDQLTELWEKLWHTAGETDNLAMDKTSTALTILHTFG